MDISALNITPTEVIEMIDNKKVHTLSEFVTMEAYNKLLDYLKSDRVALVCVASSMTKAVAYHIEKKGVKAPLPTNFRIVKNSFIEFDFPEKVDVEKSDGILTLRFDKLMMSVMDRACEIYEDNLRTIKPFQVSEVSFTRDGSILLVVVVDDMTTEWFRFVLVHKEEIKKNNEK